MSFVTKLDLAKQAKILPNQIAQFQGGISLGDRFFIKNIEIDVDNSIGDYVLAFDPLGQRYFPKPQLGTELSSFRIISGMSISGDPNNNLHLYVLPGIYQIDNNFFNFTGDTLTLTSGDTTFDRYDVLFVSGGTTPEEINTVYVLEGTPSAFPLIPSVTGQEAIVGIIKIPANTSPSTGSIEIFYPTLIEAFQVLYSRGIYNNLSEFLDGNYVRPKIITFENDINEAILGQSFSAVTLTWETNKTGFEYLLTPTGDTFNNTTFQTTYSPVTITGDTIYSLTFNDGITSATGNTVINFYNKIYYGTFTGNTIADSEIIGLQNNEIIKSNSLNRIELSGDSDYAYFCYPDRLGEVSIFVNGMYSNAFTETIQNFTNEFGYEESYRIIRTDIQINATKMFFELFPTN